MCLLPARLVLCLAFLPSLLLCARVAAAEAPSRFVLHISVDGLGSAWLQALVDSGEVPNFQRMQSEGAWTNNARTDCDFTITLPNHTSMVTSRPVRDRVIDRRPYAGHLWIINGDTQPKNLHENHHGYLPSTFDVVHDHGLRTGLFATKSKFKIYDTSYGGWGGKPDATGANDGRNKIDVYVNQPGKSPEMIQALVAAMRERPLNYSFVHLHDADAAGHSKGWGSRDYDDALRKIDRHLATLFDVIETTPALRGHTTIILSADHGGLGRDHGNRAVPRDYTIPFYVWGAGVGRGVDLYQLNQQSRRDPGEANPDYAERQQPIRNGDGGNLALALLGLPALEGSLINARQDLLVTAPPEK